MEDSLMLEVLTDELLYNYIHKSFYIAQKLFLYYMDTATCSK